MAAAASHPMTNSRSRTTARNQMPLPVRIDLPSRSLQTARDEEESASESSIGALLPISGFKPLLSFPTAASNINRKHAEIK
jgi:hypothetical protein